MMTIFFVVVSISQSEILVNERREELINYHELKSIVYTVGLGKCIMPCIHHYSSTQIASLS